MTGYLFKPLYIWSFTYYVSVIIHYAMDIEVDKKKATGHRSIPWYDSMLE